MQTINDFITEHLDKHAWQLAFIGYDSEQPNKTLMWFHTPVIASDLPANIFFPVKGSFQVMIALTPAALFAITGDYIEKESIFRLAAMCSPNDIKAVAVGERYSNYDLLHVNSEFKDKVYATSSGNSNH